MAKRDDNISSSSAGSVSVLLREMNDLGRVYIIATTNVPWQIDEAFRRRLGKIVLVDLPSLEDRARIIRSHLRGTENIIVKKEMQSIAEKTENYSGSDLAQLTKFATEVALKRSTRAKYCIVNNEKYYPCHQSAPGAEFIDDTIKMDKHFIQSPIFYCDFMRALRNIKPALDLERLNKVREFASTFGVR